jgi:hypothetical protein
MLRSNILRHNGNVLMSCGKEKVLGKRKRNLGEPEIRQVVLMEYHKHYLLQKWFLTESISQLILIPK